MTPETAHVSKAILSLIAPFLGKPYITTLMAILAGQTQAIEDAANAVVTAYDLDTATGDALAKIGAFVGQPNYGGWGDTDYRAAIKARIRIHTARGTIDDLLDVGAFFVGSGTDVQERGAAEIFFSIADASGVHLETLRLALNATRAAGVGLDLIHGLEANSLLWAGTGDTAGSNNTWGGTDDSGPGLYGIEAI